VTQAAADSTLARLRRILVTGSGFALFAIGALLLSLLVFLPILLLPMSWQRKRLRSRRALSRALRVYLGYFVASGLILPPRINGREYLAHGGQLIVASHPSLIDVLFLISLIERANCIVKPMMWRNPITLAPVHALGYIRSDAAELVEQCAQALHQGDSVIIFPEGTRTRAGAPLRFLRGAANIALTAGRDVTPVVIRCQPPILRKGQKWYQVPDHTPQFTIDIYPPLAIAPYLDSAQARGKLARQLTEDMEQFFKLHYPAESR
jgi:1-acyl-sn-glycerol-3-phosphate acyltransferase